MWVFSNIRNENRDPGILYYLTGNKVAFRVFPFADKEVRKTGIEFLHKEPVTLLIDGKTVVLGNKEETIYENVETENVVYISSQQKQTLKSVKREPHFHFLVDASEGKKKFSANFENRIEQFLKNNTEFSENAQISFVTTCTNTFPLNDNWKQQYQSQTFEGGFYLENAIKTVLFDAYKNKQYPVIVVVTDSIQNAILDKDFSDLKFTFPESELFYNLDSNGVLQEHSLIDNPKAQLPFVLKECRFCETVLGYQLSDNSIAYLPNNNQPNIILKKAIFEIKPQEIQEKN
jgi:hypothetical protein